MLVQKHFALSFCAVLAVTQCITSVGAGRGSGEKRTGPFSPFVIRNGVGGDKTLKGPQLRKLRGPPGPKGERGPRGPRGSPGLPAPSQDISQLQDTIMDQMRKYVDAKFKILEERLIKRFMTNQENASPTPRNGLRTKPVMPRSKVNGPATRRPGSATRRPGPPRSGNVKKSKALPAKRTVRSGRIASPPKNTKRVIRNRNQNQKAVDPPTTPPILNGTENCHIMTEEKCFTIIFGSVDYQVAQLKCQNIGGHLGNIYNLQHEKDIKKFLLNNKKTASYFLVGMTVDVNTQQVLLNNGSPAPFVRWFSSDYPMPDYATLRYMYSSLNAGLFNNLPQHAVKAQGVLCEF